MWHWNSLWARAPGDPPSITDPKLWMGPWSPEQAMAMQARSWEALLTATQSWWGMFMTAWPAPTSVWPIQPWGMTAPDPAASAGIEPLAAKVPAGKKAAPRRAAPRRRTPTARNQ